MNEEKFESELDRVTNLLTWMITQSKGVTQQNIKDNINVMNLIRVRSTKIWAEAMIKETESKLTK